MVAALPPSQPPATTIQKISVSMPTEMVVELRETVGRGHVSEFITTAVRHELRRAAMAKWLEETEQEFGPADATYAAEMEETFSRLAADMESGGRADD
jgi:Arc/MetJ-type ribon-helix-helix transcriptional regulator